MRVLHINTTDTGGAFVAGYRLHKHLNQSGVSSSFLVLNKQGDHPEITGYLDLSKGFGNRLKESIRYRWLTWRQDKISAGFSHTLGRISFPQTAFDITETPDFRRADLIHLHGPAGFLDYPSFFRQCTKPVVWTLHDVNPFSGMLHYYPLTGLPEQLDRLDKHIEASKIHYLRNYSRMVFVAPSTWMFKQFEKGQVVNDQNILKIPYGLDLKEFDKVPKYQVRRELGLPNHSRLVLYVAEDTKDPRKGFRFLKEAFQGKIPKNVYMLLVGKAVSKPESEAWIHLGYLEDPSHLIDVYRQCDFLIFPSEVDNLPNVVLEAMACKLPIVAFDTGGVSDMVVDQQNGFLAQFADSRALAAHIDALLTNPGKASQMGQKGREMIEEKFTIQKMTNEYLDLYQRLL